MTNIVRDIPLMLRSTVPAAVALLVACAVPDIALSQQGRPGAPLDIRPRIATPAQPSPVTPSDADAIVVPPVATSSTLIPGLPPIVGRTSAYRGRERIRLNGAVIAKRIFTANVVDGKGSGFFLLTPDGIIRPLAVTPEKMRRIYVKTEVQRLALPLRKRQRMIALASARDQGFRDIRDKRDRQGDPNRSRPLSDFFADTSLKQGDVVVTSQGLQVFRGTDVFPYSARHFMPLAQWRRVNGRENRLEGIERQLRKAR